MEEARNYEYQTSTTRRRLASSLSMLRRPRQARRQRRSATFAGTTQGSGSPGREAISPASPTASTLIPRSSRRKHLRAWLNGPHGLAAKTLERYTAARSSNKSFRFLGGLPLQKLRPAHIADWHATLLKGGGQGGRPLSARTTGHAHRVLHRSLEIALARETGRAMWRMWSRRRKSRIPKSARSRLTRSRPCSKRSRPLASADRHRGPHQRPRRGELLALDWGSVDLERGLMTISRSLEQTRAGLSFKAPKTPVAGALSSHCR